MQTYLTDELSFQQHICLYGVDPIWKIKTCIWCSNIRSFENILTRIWRIAMQIWNSAHLHLMVFFDFL